MVGWFFGWVAMCLAMFVAAYVKCLAGGCLAWLFMCGCVTIRGGSHVAGLAASDVAG